MKLTQPDNDQIIKEISETEQYLKELLTRLIALNATPRNLSDVVQALEIINRSYASNSQCGGALIGRGMAVSGITSEFRLPDSSVEQITKAVKEAIANGINAGN